MDLAVIGRLGDANLMAGLALGTLAFAFIFAFFFFLRLGTAGLVAQAVGARTADHGFVHFLRAALLSVAIGIALLVLARPLHLLGVYVLGPDPQSAGAFEIYFLTRMWSAPMVLINFSLLGWFYGQGDAIKGMLLQILVHGGNILFSILFVYGLGWGIEGVAWGTVAGQFISAVAGLGLVGMAMRPLSTLMARYSAASLLDPLQIRRLFALSRDLLIRSAALEAAFLIFTAQAAREGAVLLAANAIALNFMMVTAYFLDGQAQAAEALCGRAIGARYRPAFEKTLRLTMGWGFVIGFVLFSFWVAAGPWLIDLMTTAPEVREAARDYVLIGALATLTGVAPFVMDGVMTGATLNTLIRNGMLLALGVFLIAVFLLQPIFGLYGLWGAMHIFFIARGVIFYVAVQRRMDGLFPA